MTQELMEDIRCRGCRGYVGIGPSDARRVYHDETCANDYPADINDDRDAVIELLVELSGKSNREIGKEFGLSRQRIDQIVQRRSYY